MPAEQDRHEHRERIAAEVDAFDRQLAESKRAGGVTGYLSGAIREEIIRRGEAMATAQDLVAGVLVEIQEERQELGRVSARQAGAVADLHEMRSEVAALSSLVRNAESARADYARQRAEADRRRDADTAMIASQVQRLTAAIADQSEQIGQIAKELATRARHDSIHEEEITGVRAALVKADAKADTALSTAARAQAKQVGLKAAGWTLGVALFEALRWLMAATGKG